jgi:hypothetical protein
MNMEKIGAKAVLIFSIPCPYLKRNVSLRRDSWNYKIVPAHPEVTNRLDLIKEILSKDVPKISIYRKKGNPKKIAVFKECPHLLPYNKSIKIALYLLSENEAVITTCHGVNNIPLDMEEIR